jgi:PTH2 family peptidyl-tRNA hydrolase
MAEKVYVIIRRDLGMRRGKEIAQAGHALLALGAPADVAIITLQVDSLDDLRFAQELADGFGVRFVMIADAGRTEVEPGTETCLAAGPTTFDLFPFLTLY